MAGYVVTATIRLENEATNENEAKQIAMEDISDFLWPYPNLSATCILAFPSSPMNSWGASPPNELWGLTVL